jgi:hypothetical protein
MVEELEAHGALGAETPFAHGRICVARHLHHVAALDVDKHAAAPVTHPARALDFLLTSFYRLVHKAPSVKVVGIRSLPRSFIRYHLVHEKNTGEFCLCLHTDY